MYIGTIIDELLEEGCYEVEDGIFLWTQEKIIDEQKFWYDEDPCKNFDFTKSLFWLTHKHMIEPEPYKSFIDYITENY